ncbi:MAG: Ig-like domain-containing protein [Ruminococcus sp.]|nr:Ig-like domain-containing protein [Ruminococcus sp.]
MRKFMKKLVALTAAVITASSVSVPLVSAGASVSSFGKAAGNILNLMLDGGGMREICTSTVTASGSEAPKTEYAYAAPQTAVTEIGEQLCIEEAGLLSSEPSVSINEITGDYYVGDEFTLSITKNGCSYVEYTSSDEEIASIDSDGTVTLLAEGEVTFTVYGYSSGSVVQDSLTYTVRDFTVENYQFELDKTYDGHYFYWGYFDSAPAFQVEYTGNGAPTKWESSNGVVSVDSEGYVRIYTQRTEYEQYFEVTITASNEYYSDSITFEVGIAAYTTMPTTTTTISYAFDLDRTYDGETIYIFGNSESFTIESYSHYNSSYGVPTSWESSDPSVATVDENGQVTVYCESTYYVQEFTITITARNSYWSDSITFYVCVGQLTTTEPPPYAYISLSSPSSSDLCIGNVFELDYVAYDYDYIYWSSDNTGVATVDSYGKVTIVGSGTVTISAEAQNNYYGMTDSVTFTVEPPPTIELIEPDASLLYALNVFNIEYTGENINSITWSTSDEAIAMILSDNRVKIVGYGTVTITAKVKNSQAGTASDSVTFTISETTAPSGSPSILPTKLTLAPGDSALLTVLNVPDGETVTWLTDNTSVATVSNGTVTAVGSGTAVIYAVVGNTVCECNVTVVGFLYGDADLSGEININDAVKIMTYVTDSAKYPMTEDEINAADVYQRGDGLSNMDALAVQKKLAQLVSGLPESML